MLTPKFKLRTDAQRKDETFSVEMVVYQGHTMRRISTGISIVEKYWDQAKERAKPNAPNAAVLNAVLSEKLSRANEIVGKFALLRRKLSLDEFVTLLNGKGHIDDFLDFWEKSILMEFQRKIICLETFQWHTNALKQFRDFAKEVLKVESVLFSEISAEMIARFDIWLIAEQDKKGCKGTAAREKAQKSMRKVLRLAAKQGFQFENPFPSGIVHNVAEDRVFLTESEINLLLDLWRKPDILTDIQIIALTKFLIASFSGLRYSDVDNLHKGNLQDDYIVIRPKKTSNKGKVISVPISPILQTLFDFSEKLPHKRKTKSRIVTICPKLHNCEANEALKVIGKVAGINKILTTHVARHSFASMVLEKTGDVHLVKDLLGHSSVKTTELYLHRGKNNVQDKVNSAFECYQ